jgi:hypothetical protein
MAALTDSYHMVPRHAHETDEFSLYQEPSALVATTTMEMQMPAEAYSYPRTAHNTLGSPMAYVDPSLYTETNYMFNSRPSPGMMQDESDMRGSSSNLSTASGPSSAPSTASSPQSNPGHAASMADWSSHGLAIAPGIVGQSDYMHSADYPYGGAHLEDLHRYGREFVKGPGYVDPTMIHASEMSRPMMAYESSYSHPNSAYPVSPALSSSPQPGAMRHEPQSPFVHSYHAPYSPFQASMADTGRGPAPNTYISPMQTETWTPEETRDKQRCTCPDCGKVFKDLKAHMLTHQNERPEKCPITSCDYHIKGFARKYDKNRHTLTHYKGTMVCGFCPGSGSAAEKSFNRADVFKRHLTAVHGVEQTPPNSRKKAAAAAAAVGGAGAGSKKLAATYPSDATGKCSTCSQMFVNAQEFYEHLDDCVLRIVQQEDPAEAINAKRLAEVENDRSVAHTLEKNNLPTTITTTTMTDNENDENDEDMGEEDHSDDEAKAGGARPPRTPNSPTKKSSPTNGVQKRGMTHSRGGVNLMAKKGGRKNRREYPSSWGFDKGQMTMKKRVMTVFDGTHRLVKDDMMLSTDNEVRIPLPDGKAYVTDLDVLTLRRADGYHNASTEEKATWMANDPTKEEMQNMRDFLAGKVAPTVV